MTFAQDARFAWRMIRKNPWFSAAVVATLALGIGVNTAIFSLANAVLRKPLPFPGGERLVMVRAINKSRGDAKDGVSYADFRDFRQAAGAFEKLELSGGRSISITESANPPERYRGARVSAGMFDLLHTQPILGRGFQPADEQPGAAEVVLLSYGIWTDRYGKSRDVIGRAIRANDKPATIVGVMPDGFKFPTNQEIWMVAVPDAENQKRTFRGFDMVGILKKDSSIAEATAAFNTVAQRLEKEFPDTHKNHGIAVQTFHQAMNGGQIRTMFMLLLGAVGFVLLIACANVANMLLSRAIGRNREMSIRAALGAGRWRIVRQLLVESVMLSVAGGVIGLSLAQLGIHWFGLAVADVGKPYWIDFSLDYVVLMYFCALSVISGIVFGIAPALRASRVDLNDALKEGARSSGGARGGYLTGALVVFQFTLAVVLLSGAGLMIRSFLKAQDEFSYLQPDQVLHARWNLPDTRYPKPENKQQFYEKLLPRLKALPGASAAALVSNPPGMGSAGWRVELKERPIAERAQRPATAAIVVSPNYLQVLGLPILQGRDFNDSDGLPGKEAVIVSREFAARHFPKDSPLGKQIRLFDGEKEKPWMTIVGVVPGLRQNNPTETGQDPLVLLPYRSEPWSGMTIMIRTAGPVTSLAAAVRREVQAIDQEMPLYDVAPLEERFARDRWHYRVFGTTFLIFAFLALGMAALGIYAVMAHATGQRRQEIGVRMALGASFQDVVRLVLGRGLIQLGLGTVLGLAAAVAVCRLMSKFLFQISATDTVTLGIVTAALLTAGLAACWIPARRAAKLDPLKALRYE